MARRLAMELLANGLSSAKHHEDALAIREAELSTRRRLGADEASILVAQNNLACTYEQLGRNEEALQVRWDVYSGRLKLNGEEHERTLRAANNYAHSLLILRRFQEAKVVFRKIMPTERRVLGESHQLTLRTRWNYAEALYRDEGATLDDFREAVTTLEDVASIARRVLGSANPLTRWIEEGLRNARAALRAAEQSLNT